MAFNVSAEKALERRLVQAPHAWLSTAGFILFAKVRKLSTSMDYNRLSLKYLRFPKERDFHARSELWAAQQHCRGHENFSRCSTKGPGSPPRAAARKEAVAENPASSLARCLWGTQQSLTHLSTRRDKQGLRKETMKMHISHHKYLPTY